MEMWQDEVAQPTIIKKDKSVHGTTKRSPVKHPPPVYQSKYRQHAYMNRMGQRASITQPPSQPLAPSYSMAPQTRSTTKSPGRSTRNSVYGRSPLPPTMPRKSPTGTPPSKTTPSQEKRVRGKATAKGKKGTPWLACRDDHGVFTTVSVSETGEGVHVRWYYPEDGYEILAKEGPETSTAVDAERDVTPQPPSKGERTPFPQTPVAPQTYDAGSVILTPVKRARPLRSSPPRIGDKGVRCLFEKDGVLRDLNDEARIVLRHPAGTPANLTREQVERLENEREDRIALAQVAKLLAAESRMEEESSVDEDEMETDDDQSRRHLGRQGSGDTVLISHSDLSGQSQVSVDKTESTPTVFRGPNGELLDRHGRQMLGPEGTVLIDSTYTYEPPQRALEEKVPAVTGNGHPGLDHPTGETSNLRRPRFGPEGTELID